MSHCQWLIDDESYSGKWKTDSSNRSRFGRDWSWLVDITKSRNKFWKNSFGRKRRLFIGWSANYPTQSLFCHRQMRGSETTWPPTRPIHEPTRPTSTQNFIFSKKKFSFSNFVDQSQLKPRIELTCSKNLLFSLFGNIFRKFVSVKNGSKQWKGDDCPCPVARSKTSTRRWRIGKIYRNQKTTFFSWRMYRR